MDSSVFTFFTTFVMIVYFFLSIVIIIRWWKLTTNVEQIRKYITHADQELPYLVAIGEKEQAQKAALTRLVDELYSIYEDSYISSKADKMDTVINTILPKMQRLGISLPDYVTSGKKFIDYINELTDNKVPYAD